MRIYRLLTGIYTQRQAINKGVCQGLTSTPSKDTFIYGVHDGSIGHDAHEMSTETTVERPRALFCNYETKRLNQACILHLAIYKGLS
jgi:hypothetical protein